MTFELSDSPVLKKLTLLQDAQVSSYLQKKNHFQSALDAFSKLLKAETPETTLEKISVELLSENSELALCTERLLKIGFESHLIPPSSHLLHYAATQNNAKLFLKLLELGADIHETHDYSTPLELLSEETLSEVLNGIIERNKSGALQIPLHTLELYGQSLLFRYAQWNHVPMIEKLIENGLSIDAWNTRFLMPLSNLRNPAVLAKIIAKTMELEEESLLKQMTRLYTNPSSSYWFADLPYTQVMEVVRHLANRPEVIKNNPNLCTVILKEAITAHWKKKEHTPQEKEVFHAYIAQSLPHLNEVGQKTIWIYAMRYDQNEVMDLILAQPNTRSWIPHPYGSPILYGAVSDRESLSKITPLEDAYQEQNRHALTKLLDQGLSIHDREGNGYSLLERMIDSPSTSETRLCCLLLAEKQIPVDRPNAQGLNLVESIVTNDLIASYWPFFQELLKSQVSLKFFSEEVVNALLSQALKENKPELFLQLFDKFVIKGESSHLQELSENVWKGILHLKNRSQMQKILNHIQQHLPGENLERGLLVAVKDNKLEAAAYLHVLGGKLSTEIPTEIKNSIGRYAANLKKGSPAEQTLRSQLELKKLAFLVGDAAIDKMRDDDGSKIEGGSASDMMAFGHALLSYYRERNVFENTPEAVKVDQVLRDLSRGLPFAHSLDFARSPENVGKRFREQLSALQPGERLLTLSGWSQGTETGHAMLLEAIKQPDGSFIFLLFNTGAGTEYHDQHIYNHKRYVNTIKAYCLTPEQLDRFDLCTTLLEPQTLGAANKFHYEAKDLYNLLQPFALSQENQAAFLQLLSGYADSWMEGQLSGSCSLSVIMAYLTFRLGPESYKPLKSLVKQDCLALSIEQNRDLIGQRKALRKILSRALPTVSGNLGKKIQARAHTDLEGLTTERLLLEKTEHMRQTMRELFPEAITHNPAIPVQAVSETETDRINHYLKSDHSYASRALPHRSPSRAVLPIGNLTSDPELFAKLLKEMETYSKANRDPIVLEEFLRRIGRQFLEPGSPSTELLAALKNWDKEAIEKKLLAPLHAIAESYLHNNPDEERIHPLSLAPKTTLYFALLMAQELCAVIDPTLTQTPISPDDFTNECAKQRVFVGDPDLEKEIALIRNNLEKRACLAKYTLFDFSRQTTQATNGAERLKDQAFKKAPYLELKGGEEVYASTLYERLSKEDRDLCEQAYLAELKNENIEITDKARWQSTWAYVNKAPGYFHLYRSLSMMARVEGGLTRGMKAKKPFSSQLRIGLHQTGDAGGLKKGVVGYRSNEVTTRRLLDPESSSKYPLSKVTNLPFNLGRLSDKTSNSRDESGAILKTDTLSLEPLSQNRINAAAHSALIEPLCSRIGTETAEAKVTSIPYTLLIEFFKQDPSAIKKQEYRALCMTTFFSQEGLYARTLEVFPYLGEELNQLFQFLAETMKTDFAARMAREESVDGLIWALEMRQKHLRWLQATQGREISKEMEAIRQELQIWLEHSVCQKPAVQQTLLLVLLDSYHEAKSYSADEIEGLILAMAKKRVLEENQAPRSLREQTANVFPTLMVEARKTPYYCQQQIRAYCLAYPERAYRLLDQLAALRGQTLPRDGNWNWEHFPFVSVQQGDVRLEFDLCAGTLLKNGLALSPIAKYAKDPLYRKVFAPNCNHPQFEANLNELMRLYSVNHDPSIPWDPLEFPVIKKGDIEIDLAARTVKTGSPWHPSTKSNVSHLYDQLIGSYFIRGHPSASNQHTYVCEDAHGQIILEGTGEQLKFISREFTVNGSKEWYAYAGRNPYLPDLPPLILWRKNGAQPLEFIYVDPVTMAPKCLVKEGLFFFLDRPEKAYEWVKIDQQPQWESLKAFHPEALLFQEKDGPGALLQLPYFVDEESQPLEFEKRENRWICKSLPNFHLSEDQTLPGIYEFRSFLILENDKGQKQALIPKIPFKDFQDRKKMTSNIACQLLPVKSSGMSPQTLEKKLLGAYLQLTHAVSQEDFTEALQLLKGAFKFEAYTDEELRLLGWIFNCNKETFDNSGQADSVRLLAAWLVDDNFKRNPKSKIPNDSSVKHKSLPSFSGPGIHWRHYWQNNWIWKNKKKEPCSLMSQVRKLQNHYLSRKNRVEADLQLENILDPWELFRWNFPRQGISSRLPGDYTHAPLQEVTPHLNSEYDLIGNAEGTFRLRAAESKYGFSYLYQLARRPQTDPKHQETLDYFLHITRYDTDPSHYAKWLLLNEVLKIRQKAQEISVRSSEWAAELLHDPETLRALDTDPEKITEDERAAMSDYVLGHTSERPSYIIHEPHKTQSTVHPLDVLREMIHGGILAELKAEIAPDQESPSLALIAKLAFPRLIQDKARENARGIFGNILTDIYHPQLVAMDFEDEPPLPLPDFTSLDQLKKQVEESIAKTSYAHSLIDDLDYMIKWKGVNSYELIKRINLRVEELAKHPPQPDFPSFQAAFTEPAPELVSTFTKPEPIKITPLPKEPPAQPPVLNPLPFHTPVPILSSMQSWFDAHFQPARPPNEDASAPQIETFTYNPKNNYQEESQREHIQKSLVALNTDYAAGAKKNLNIPYHILKEGKSLTPLKKTVLEERADKLQLLATKRAEMLQLANTFPSGLKEAALHEAQLGAGKRNLLKEEDCAALFLQNDSKNYQASTFLNPEQVARLHELIGNVLLLTCETDHLEKLVSNLELYEKDPDNTDPVQTIGQLLNTPQLVNPATDPAAFLVFQYKMKLFMRQDQLDGLKEMMPKDGVFPNVILQRIQGGGKTLVFGHLMALLKADGYHLSIHVPPTAQYGSVINDMKFISEHACGQKERTLSFDDSPQDFTPKSLTFFKETLIRAIHQNEYVTITSESLKALRCKYFKVRWKIQTHAADPVQKAELEKSNQILKEILKLIDERGVFTLDEIHQVLAPHISLNMPAGEKTKVDVKQAKVVAAVLNTASSLKDDKGNQLLQLATNQQSQQSKEASDTMLRQTVEEILKDTNCLTLFGIAEGPDKESQIAAVKAFISGKTGSLPLFLEKLHREQGTGKRVLTAADHVILARQLIHSGWLADALSKSVNEHFGFSCLPLIARIAIPYIANQKPAEGSEFSDQIVMITNTLITYAVEGLNEQQAQDFLNWQLSESYKEHTQKVSVGLSSTLASTPVAIHFKAVMGRDLDSMDGDDPAVKNFIRQKLSEDTPQTRELLFSFVAEKVLPKVDFYQYQISTHGQGFVSMAHAFNGYSGSCDNPNMKPYGSDIQPEIGTNGQTIDVILRKNEKEAVAIDAAPEALFTQLIDLHPQRKNVRAIIDVGCQFRGIRNENVAKMILQHLEEDSPVKGVLYFNQEDGKLYCMPREPLKQDRPICLSGTRKEIILAETGLEPSELFTYYDQEHITGVDITQDPKGVAVITISEHSKIHEVLQGARRMRALDLGQRLLFALQKGALGKISMKLEKELEDNCLVHDLLLYTHLKEVESEPDENFRFCVQKLEAKVQKEVLKRLFQQEEPALERELFERIAYLFVKDITLDLYREYAYPHERIEKAKFLKNLKESLIGPLQNVPHLFTEEEWSTLSSALGEIIDEALPGIQKLLAYNAPEGRNSTNTQYQQVQVEQTSLNINQNINQNLNVQKVSSTKLDQERGWPVEILAAGEFLSTFGKEGIPNVQRLSEKINSSLFSEDLYITSNFATTFTDRADGPKEMKAPYEILGIEDATGKRRLLLCTVKEAQDFEHMMLTGGMKPKDKKIWLMRTNGTLIASSEHRRITKEVQTAFKNEVILGEREDLRQLLIEAIFFSGKLHLLNEKEYLKLFKSWVKDQTESYQKFFEAYLTDKATADYANTLAYRSLVTTR